MYSPAGEREEAGGKAVAGARRGTLLRERRGGRVRKFEIGQSASAADTVAVAPWGLARALGIAVPALPRPFCRRVRSRLVDAGVEQYNSHLLGVRAREIQWLSFGGVRVYHRTGRTTCREGTPVPRNLRARPPDEKYEKSRAVHHVIRPGPRRAGERVKTDLPPPDPRFVNEFARQDGGAAGHPGGTGRPGRGAARA